MTNHRLKENILLLFLILILLVFSRTTKAQCIFGVSTTNVTLPGDGSTGGYVFIDSGSCESYSVSSNDTWFYFWIDYYEHTLSIYADPNYEGYRTGTIVIQDGWTNEEIYISVSQDVSQCPQLPSPGNISGTSNICANESATFSISPIQGATCYVWYLNGNHYTTEYGTTSATIYFGGSSNPSILSVAGYNECQLGIFSSKEIAISYFNTVSSTSGTSTTCISSVLSPITRSTTGATGIGSPSGLPSGVNATWASNTITITGTPTQAGTFNYSIPLTGGCGNVYATGTITVNPAMTVSAASSTPTLCIYNTLSITHSTSVATGIGSPSGLPSGVNATWAPNTITISGTPTQAGTFNYSIPLTGGCGTVNATGTIIVNPAMTVSAASSTPTLCINTSLTNITHSTSVATGIGSPSGLPSGVNATWAPNTITLSGIPTQAGTFNYSIPLTGGCGTVNATGTITVNPAMTVSAASSTPTLCIYNTLSITHSTSVATGIGSPSGLPSGVNATWAPSTITISGTPTQAGTFNYSIPLTGGCGTVNATGTITVNPAMTVSAASSTPTLCINTSLTNITHSTSVATGIGSPSGLPSGVNATWAPNTITLSGIPTQAGTFNYSIPLTGGCGTVNATGTITVNPAMTVSAASSTPTLCIYNTLSITHSTSVATGIGSPSGLPSGVNATWAPNTITISGTPTQAGTFNYSIPLTGGCGPLNATGTIIVNPAMTVSAASSTPTLCINTSLTNITHSTNVATSIGSPSGLPNGITASWAANTITISGTPTQAGTFDYSIPLIGGCGNVSATGTITVNPDLTVTMTGGTSPIVYGGSPGIFTANAQGGTGSYNFVWYSNNIPICSTQSFTPQNIVTSSIFYCIVSSGACVRNTTEKVITVFDPLEVNVLMENAKLNFSTLAGTQSKNFIKEIVYREPSDSVRSGNFKHSETIQYYDGLGRLSQTILVGASPVGNDIIQPVIYDEYGRETYKTLPFTASRSGAFRNGSNSEIISAVNTYYSSNILIGKENDNKAYSQTVFENSPLNRIMSQTGLGSAWADKPVQINYLSNDQPEEGWKVNGDYSYGSANYPSHSLYVTETIDEDGNYSREFKDKLGQVVLKKSKVNGAWIRTAYIYDDFGLLRCVIPPKSDNPNADTSLCYYYLYDRRNRLVEKKIPGSGSLMIVYDNRDRIRFTQDANQSSSPKRWTFTKYDELNRPIFTGIFLSNGDTASIRASINDNAINETKLDGIYTTNSFPMNNYDTLTVTYYDDYDFRFKAGQNLSTKYNSSTYDDSDYNFSSNLDTYPKERITAKITKVLSDLLDASIIIRKTLYSVFYYNNYGNILRSIQDDQTRGLNVTSNFYEEITYNLLRTKQLHDGSEDIIIEKFLDYDHAGRLLSTRLKVNNSTNITLNSLAYNDIGELVNKYLHSAQFSGNKSFTQKIDYKYNVRGWLTKINDPGLNSDNDLYGMDLYYNSTTGMGGLAGSGQFNGNISGIKWGTRGEPVRGYRFSYDNLNRLTTGKYAEGSDLNLKVGFNDEIISEYDNNGNIKKLNRKYNDVLIDSLKYMYRANSNILDTIYDKSGNDKGYPGNSKKYTYQYGNLISDGSKNIEISYHSTLNLPSKVDFGNDNKLFYHYSSEGSKLAMHSKPGGNSQDPIYYVGNIVYKGSSISYISIDEGRIIPAGPVGQRTFTFEYDLKDHLGSNRVTFVGKPISEGIEIVQKVNYYPFGLLLDTVSPSQLKNKYLYNSKEIQNDIFVTSSLNWYDYGARFYDPQIGRWTTVDPLEQYDSPYIYVNNNPMCNYDPTGMWGEIGTNYITKTVVDPTSEIIYHDDSPNKNIYLSWDGIKGSDGNIEGLEAVGTEDPNVDYSKGRFWNGLYRGQPNTTGYMPVWFNDKPGLEPSFVDDVIEIIFTGGGIILIKKGGQWITKRLTQEVVEEIVEAAAGKGVKIITKEGVELFSDATLQSFERQLAKHGTKALTKSQKNIEKWLAEHLEKLDAIKKAGGHTSSVEREIRTAKSQLEAIKYLLNK